MMSITFALLAGILAGIPISGLLFGRWVSEEGFLRYLRRIASRRGWPWLLESACIGEAVARERLARKQVALLGQCLERLRVLTYDDSLAFGPAGLGASEQLIRVDHEEQEGGLQRPILIISGSGPWKILPLEEATPRAVLHALGPVDARPQARAAAETVRLASPEAIGWLLAQVSDEHLRRLPGAQRTSLVHALVRDDELPGVVEGLVDRHQRRKAS